MATQPHLHEVEPADSVFEADRLRPGARLVGVDLSGLDLSGVDLTGADLSGADLSRCRLMKSRLDRANLHGARLDGANLLEASLVEATCSEISGRGVILGHADLSGADFFAAELGSATLSGARADRADLRRARMEGARMLETSLQGAELRNADLTGADLSGARIAHADFGDSCLRRARVRGLDGASSANWVGVDVHDVDFTGAYLTRRSIMDVNYLYEFRSSSRLNGLIYHLWKLTSDCGRSLIRWGALTFVVSMAYAVLYTLVAIDYGPNETALSPVYFSFVTITTLGYGDVVPASLAAQTVVLSEVIFGYLMLGGLLSVFATKMGRRAE